MCNKAQGFYQSQVSPNERIAIIAEMLQANARMCEEETTAIDLACAIEAALFPNNERGNDNDKEAKERKFFEESDKFHKARKTIERWETGCTITNEENFEEYEAAQETVRRYAENNKR